MKNKNARKKRNKNGAYIHSDLVKKVVYVYFQDISKSDQFNISNESLSGFDSLHSIFIHIQSVDLQSVSKLPLRDFHFFSDICNIFSTDIISSILCLVYEHKNHPFDIQCLTFRRLYAMFLTWLTFTKCQKAESGGKMKRIILFLLAISIAVLAGCGDSLMHSGFEADDAKDPILGKWESDSRYVYFLENGVYCTVFLDNEMGEIVYTESAVADYIVNEDSISVSADDYESVVSYWISEDRLVIDEDAELTRGEVEPTQYDIVGEWKLAGTEGEFESFDWQVANDYIRAFTFYSDNTYKADWGFTHRGEEYIDDPTYGSYQLVNDGRVICFDNRGYYDYELLGYGLLKLVEPSGNVLIYILQ